jgi:hypothetical protein
MQFSPELRADVLAGEITVSFRLWVRAQVKSGGRYRVADGKIEVDSIEPIPFAFIEAADVRRSGEKNLEALRQRAAHAGPIGNDTLLYRIEFQVVKKSRHATLEALASVRSRRNDVRATPSNCRYRPYRGAIRSIRHVSPRSESSVDYGLLHESSDSHAGA